MSARAGRFFFTCLALAIILGATFSGNVVLRSIGSLLLVFFLPGHAFLAGLGVTGLSKLERHTFGTGLSVALTILGGLALNSVGTVTPVGWAIWLGSATLIASGVAFFQTTSGRCSGRDIEVKWVLKLISFRHVVMLSAAAIIAGVTFVAAIRGEQDYHPFQYTDFWIVPDRLTEPGSLILGVRNSEAKDEQYDIEVYLHGTMLAAWRGLHLRRGDTLTREVSLPFATGDTNVTAWLFISARPTLVYREVSYALGGE